MKINKEEKRQNALEILKSIHNCKTEYDLERVSDILDESIFGKRIFKKDYKFLSEELDDQLMNLIDEGLI